ncbi:hypothetical protein [Candidatus Nitrospira nitrosa]|nr:hypothetical protein [Candidatus Nitrospira nitrosa]
MGGRTGQPGCKALRQGGADPNDPQQGMLKLDLGKSGMPAV